MDIVMGALAGSVVGQKVCKPPHSSAHPLFATWMLSRGRASAIYCRRRRLLMTYGLFIAFYAPTLAISVFAAWRRSDKSPLLDAHCSTILYKSSPKEALTIKR
jgi:hypothetical protein